MWRCVVQTVLLMGMLSPPGAAAPQSRTLPVSVAIVVNQSSATLEIEASQHAFTVFYHPASQRFLPLDIPFNVRSRSGRQVSYVLSLALLAGQCDGRTPLVPTAMLDHQAASLGQARRFEGVKRAHVLTLSFPARSQASLAQYCDGYAGVTAELAM
ncbi:hypothetical protein [Aeromonas hydrophila]|uniref:hypothetical protein n=1 Tax=Aeromonas hydrophila TaxID=644 RepID=UPI0035B9FE2E